MSGEFESSIRAVKRHFDRMGLGHVFAGVRRISVVREESYHDVRNRSIGLNPADARRPFAAVQRRPYLLVHELGHHFARAGGSSARARTKAVGPTLAPSCPR